METSSEGESALILVVDDEQDIRELVALRLEQGGHRTITAGDGKAGLEMAVRERPDLVVLDVRMPGLDGYEVTQGIRADEEIAQTPILLLSASVDEDEVSAGMDSGADAYLLKPFNPDELRAKVAELLATSARRS